MTIKMVPLSAKICRCLAWTFAYFSCESLDLCPIGNNNRTMKISLLSAALILALALTAFNGGAYPIGRDCVDRDSGETWNCHCKTGTNYMYDDTIVFNQCSLGKDRGASHGEMPVELNGRMGMGMAVYSGKSTSICGGSDTRCKCTCFDEAAVDGVSEPRFQTDKSTKNRRMAWRIPVISPTALVCVEPTARPEWMVLGTRAFWYMISARVTLGVLLLCPIWMIVPTKGGMLQEQRHWPLLLGTAALLDHS